MMQGGEARPTAYTIGLIGDGVPRETVAETFRIWPRPPLSPTPRPGLLFFAFCPGASPINHVLISAISLQSVDCAVCAVDLADNSRLMKLLLDQF